MNSLDLYERSLRVAPGGVHSPVRSFKSVGGHPIFFKSAKGCHLTSVEGDEYIDFCQSFGPLILGHRDFEVEKVVASMVQKMWTSGTCEGYSLELAEWIVEHIPSIEKLRFVSSGTEAVMSALRVARAATGREKILKFEGCYHGHVDSLLVKSGSGLAGESASSSAGVSEVIANQTVVCPLDDEEAFLKALEANKSQLAAVILEPLPANFGLLEQREDFLRFVFNEAKKRDVLVIFDEVISGFRVSLGGMAEKLNLTPDLITYGKIIGGGFPVGCYGGRKDLMDLVAPLGPVYQAGTLSANPIGMAAGLATLKKAKRDNIWGTFEKASSNLNKNFNTWAEKQNIKTRVNTFGSLFWFAKSDKPLKAISEIDKDHGKDFKAVFNSLIKEGVYLAPNGYEVCFMGAAHTDEIMELALEKFKKVFSSLEE